MFGFGKCVVGKSLELGLSALIAGATFTGGGS